MKDQIKNCQSCKKNFTIRSEDFPFYQKIKVPLPTFCSECRLIRRLAYREGRSFYKDVCDKCGEDIISLFAPGNPFTVYCTTCWWKDDWDATKYGREYDFTKPFFEQMYELQKIVPIQAITSKNSTDCRYCTGVIRCKNCTFVFRGFQSINCYYCDTPGFSRDSIDSDLVINGDHTYETLNSNGMYNTKFAYFSDECFDSSFIFDCKGCSNCFGCVNLRNQKYQIFNTQYTKEEYGKEIIKWDLGNYEILQEAKRKFLELYYKIPRRYALIINSSNVAGDDIKNTKNCQTCFATRHGVENCKYVFSSGLLLKDSYDVDIGGDTSELLYEVTGGIQSQQTKFTRGANNAIDVEYSDSVYGGSNLFGCVKLRTKKYCILNKQYTKEEYEILIPKIRKHMDDLPYIDEEKRVYKYGEFFPSKNSYWAYNETLANQYFPLTKEQAVEKCFSWRDSTERDYKVTMKSEDLPVNIKDVSNDILDEVIVCGHSASKDDQLISNCNEQCATAFRILPNELNFYRTMNLALPRLCPNCRFAQRFKYRNPLKLWRRKCMCKGVGNENGEYKNTTKHFHGENQCTNEFQTAIGDERKEIVYCEKCYQAEFI